MRAKKNLEAANNELEINLDNALKVRWTLGPFSSFPVLSLQLLILLSNHESATKFRFDF